jgi:hypothetical protein
MREKQREREKREKLQGVLVLPRQKECTKTEVVWKLIAVFSISLWSLWHSRYSFITIE